MIRPRHPLESLRRIRHCICSILQDLPTAVNSVLDTIARSFRRRQEISIRQIHQITDLADHPQHERRAAEITDALQGNCSRRRWGRKDGSNSTSTSLLSELFSFDGMLTLLCSSQWPPLSRRMIPRSRTATVNSGASMDSRVYSRCWIRRDKRSTRHCGISGYGTSRIIGTVKLVV